MPDRPHVLVTGARGFIGSHVVAALELLGAVPVAVAGNYHHAHDVERALRDVEPASLIHCAWRLEPGSAYLHDPANIIELRASLQLFTIAERLACPRVVGIGSCLEYEPSDGPTDETTPLRPHTVYGGSKAALFMAADAWARGTSMSFAWARLYFPFGPREAPQRLIPSVVKALLREERIATTAGRQRRSFVYVGDAADAIAALALSDAEGAFNIGGSTPIAVRELVERLADALGRRDLLDVGKREDRPGDPEVLWANTTRLRTSVGWEPSTGLDEALDQTIAWWKASM
jgi:nucleoside-diphosphate-sugar epimerase